LIQHIKTGSKAIFIVTVVAFVPAFFSACSFQQYIPKPIDPLASVAKFKQKDPSDEPFHQYLLNNGYTSDSLPLQEWGVDELTYCALFFHPSLDVARSQWRAAESAEVAAAEKITPTANGSYAHSNLANDDKSPYAVGLSIDIPIETANKRDIRIENARHLSQAAKFEIAQTAWRLRNQVAQSLNEYQFNQQQIRLLTEEVARRQEIVAIYQKRLSLGAASNVELSTARLQLQTTASELNARQQNRLVLLSKLASNIGLPLAKVEAMHLLSDNDKQQANSLAKSQLSMPADLQTAALLNRLDIRIALERYAAAEAKLKLEIAKQYPDIVISPGYAYEFGDKIWSLGLSGLLTLLNKNKVAIAEATQLREVEFAQFEALQTKVIAEANIANAELVQAKQALLNQQELFQQQQFSTQRMQQKLVAGEIDRLELALIKLENIAAEKNVVLADFQLNSALSQLENTLQQPLSNSQVTMNHIADIEDLSLKK
jgi:outer membrane protein TolC